MKNMQFHPSNSLKVWAQPLTKPAPFAYSFFLKTTGKYCLVWLIVLFCSAGQLSAQDVTPVTWTGTTSTDWHIGSNWSGGSVPGITNTVTIPNVANDPVISNRGTIVMNLTILKGAVLTIAQNQNLWVYSYSPDISFLNQGTVTNGGTISINKEGLQVYSSSNVGIKNEGVFNNNAGGTVEMRNTTYGFWHASGTFVNQGDLSILSLSKCIYNESAFTNGATGSISVSTSNQYVVENFSGTFTNSGALRFTSVAYNNPGTHALINRAVFNNDAGGLIEIGSSSDIGILNAAGTFNNTASIKFKTTFHGPYGIQNAAVFNNNAGGLVEIINPSLDGLWNKTGSTFTNAGTLTFGLPFSVDKCIYNEATFNNNAGGVINATTSKVYGIEHYSGTFNNNGTITLGASGTVGSIGLITRSNFNNNTSGAINVNSSDLYGMEHTAGTFTNNGTIKIGTWYDVGNYGLRNSAVFNNNTGALINISRFVSFGLRNNAGTFTNAGSVVIGYPGGAYTTGISNSATINNNAGGAISIDRATIRGIINVTGASFNNAANITISNALSGPMQYGIDNDGAFNNNGGGQIKIDGSASYGVWNDAGTFNNAATLTIGAMGAVGAAGIYNATTFRNNTGGVINIDRVTTEGIKNITGTFTNNATIKIGEITPVSALFNGSAGEFSNGTGGILKGTGSIDAEFFTNAGGTLSPGYSPGIQSFPTGENFSSSILSMEITGMGGVAGTDFDRVAVNGTVTLGSTTKLNLTFSTPITNGSSFDILTATGISGAISLGNISFINTDAGNVTGVSVSYPSSNLLRVTVTSPLSLPVTLVSFVAKAEGGARQLYWETSMETDNDYFEIQRSTDAKNFFAIGWVKGEAAGFKMLHYTYTDAEITSAGLYYRLKMVDLDGTFAYSRVQSVQMDQAFEVRMFPNPVSVSLTIEAGAWEKVGGVKLYDMSGHTVYNSALNGLSKSIDVKSMAEGAYVVELLLKNGQTQTSRIVVTK